MSDFSDLLVPNVDLARSAARMRSAIHAKLDFIRGTEKA